ncbi:MAG: hypothetical protein H7833_01905 [Magnetococcus sp. DMHC-1]
MTTTDENTTSSGKLVSDFLTGASWADTDTTPSSGMAITATTGNGTWQFSTDNATWTNFGAVTTTSALLLTSTSYVRYVPDSSNGETGTFTYRAWDQTSGTASTNGSASQADPSSNGGTTAYSSNTAGGSITVTSVNDAPTITNGASTSLTTTDENTTSSGKLVSDFLTGAGQADVDTGASSGLAITATTGNGTWQFSTDNATWTNFGSVSTTSALLLTSSTYIRYVPDNNNGETATFTYRAWDQTSGTASTNGTASTADPSTNGTSTAYSSNTAGGTITVTSVNDAPTITNGSSVSFTSVNAATTSTSKQVSTLLTGATQADVDTGASSGIAITATTGSGTWYYSTDDTTWNSFGAVSAASSLLLSSSSYIRYVPDGSTIETATFTFRAWDQTTGTASTNGVRGNADSSSTGTTTAYSTSTATGTLSVTEANAAPTITNGASTSLTTTDENTTSSGKLVSDFLTGASWADTNTTPSSGMAITATTGNGTWQFSTDNATWTSFGAVTTTSALLLTSSSYVRYVPDSNNGETATFTYRAWDQTTGTASTNGSASKADPSSNGGTTAYSSNTAGGTLTVTSVNDAPTLTNGASTSLTTTDENTTSASKLVSAFLTGAGQADVDTGASSGMAITATTGNGTWQFSTDDTTWTNFGTVSTTSALLLTSSTYIRYIPDSNNGETATFTYRAWDQTTGTASTNGSASKADPSTNGTSTAYSSNTAGGTLTVTSVNDAPTITNGASTTLTTIDENTTGSGKLVSDFLTGAGLADVDTGASSGMAITATTGNGTWQFSTDNATWTGFGAVTTTSALLLTSSSYIRYVPDGNNGETATLTYRGWDQTTGTASTNGTASKADPSTNGTTTAYSSNTAGGTLTVTSVNDAPTVTNGASTSLTTTDEDTTSSGKLVSDFLTGAGQADVDTGASSGMAITATTGNGTWQFSTDNTTWTNFGTVSTTSALLLTSSSYVRYIPDNNNGETATFTYRGWDQTSGTASTNGSASKADPSTNGTSTAYSSNTAGGTLTVTSVNDAPTITSGASVSFTSVLATASNSTSKQVSTILTGASLADVDTGYASGIAITATTGSGTWYYSTDDATWTSFGAVSAASSLLLSSSSYIRYVPDGSTYETATFSFRAWDQTTGSASTNGGRSNANSSSNGTTTAYSSNSATGTISVTEANAAPTITNGASTSLTTTDENTTSSGKLVSAFLTGASWADTNTSPSSGMAITATTGNGTWQYSTDNSTWNNVGAVTTTSALLLSSSTYIRYVPDGNNGETATFTYRAWDQTTGTASTNATRNTADPSTNGTDTAYSTNTAGGTITVTSVNDAPTITNGASTSLTTTDENTTSASKLVSAFLTGAGQADVDTGASSGMAITATTGNGTWQFSTDDTTWTNFGTVSTTSALLLTSSTYIRYIPDSSNGETATFTYRAWDQTSGTASTNGTASKADPSTNGTSTAYSSNTAGGTITITSLNDAPTVTSGGTATLTTTDENTTSSSTLVSTVLSGVGWADVDTGASSGIAVTATTGNGTWYYSTDNTTWNSFGAVSTTSALLLSSGSYVRYVPDGNNGETATFSFRAWDQTTGTASTNGTRNTADPSTNGTTTAFSANSAGASLTVSSVNDAPTITNAASTSLTTIDENTTGSGKLVSDFLTGANLADVDTGASSGLAITATTGNGTWQFSTDNTTWTNFGTVSTTSALLLTSSSYIRYVPDGSNGETATFTYRGWDQSSGTASTNGTASKADPSTNGTSTAYSSNTAGGTITVTSVNDAPTVTSGASTSLTTTDEATTSASKLVSAFLTGSSQADVDTGASSGLAITATTGNGTWQYSTDNTTWNSVGTVSTTSALLLSSSTYIRYVPDNNNGETATFTYRAWDQTTGTASTNSTRNTADPSTNGTSTAYSSNTATGTITVTSINSAPTITSGVSTSLTTTDEGTTSSGSLVSAFLTAAGQADTDSGASSGLAITATTGNGTWQYSTDGTTWNSFGSVSSTAALLLTSSSYIRYVPDGNNGETATFTYRAWDQTSGTASTNSTRGTADTSTTGSTSAYSTNTSGGTITVTSVNDAPTLTSAAMTTLTTINEDTTGSATLVSTILSGASMTDVDTSAASGLAITATTGNGTWQYSTDGTTWNSFGSVSSSAALLLTSSSYIRYVPDGSNGETATFTYRGWDQTSGTASTNSTRGTADTGTTGTTTAFSSDTAGGTLTVSSVNDAPTLTSAAMTTLTTTNEDTASTATLVSTILSGASITDVDTSAASGLAITATTGNGTWQYSTDGTTWNGFGSVSSSAALLLTSSSYIRYVPDGSNGETATFTYRGWDQTSGTASTNSTRGTADTSTTGTTTAFSANTAGATITVTGVNDAPTITDAALVNLTGVDAATTSAIQLVSTLLNGVRWADVDHNALGGLAITATTGSGTWQYATDGTTWNSFGSVSASASLLLSSTSSIRYVPDGTTGETATVAFRAWDQTSGTASTSSTRGTADTSRTGTTTAFSAHTAVGSLKVTGIQVPTTPAIPATPPPANTAPTLTDGSVMTLKSIDQNATSVVTPVAELLAHVDWADKDKNPDSGLAVIATTGKGTWQYSTSNGTWVDFGAVTSESALLLDKGTRIRYVADGLTAETATFAFRAWDQTTGTASTTATRSTASTTIHGSSTAFSTGTASATLSVTRILPVVVPPPSAPPPVAPPVVANAPLPTATVVIATGVDAGGSLSANQLPTTQGGTKLVTAVAPTVTPVANTTFNPGANAKTTAASTGVSAVTVTPSLSSLVAPSVVTTTTITPATITAAGPAASPAEVLGLPAAPAAPAVPAAPAAPAAPTTPATPATPAAPAVQAAPDASANNTPPAPAAVVDTSGGNRTLTQTAAPGGFQTVVITSASGVASGVTGLVLNQGIKDQVVPASGPFQMSVPVDAFAHTDPNAVVQLQASQANGQPLPGWLAFNPANGKFEGTPPPGALQNDMAIRVLARDSSGNEAVTVFVIKGGQQNGAWNIDPSTMLAQGDGEGMDPSDVDRSGDESMKGDPALVRSVDKSALANKRFGPARPGLMAQLRANNQSQLLRMERQALLQAVRQGFHG